MGWLAGRGLAGGDCVPLQEATADAFKTLFVARLAYDVDERKLKREMEHYGV